jgi:hypothetical protein
MCSKTVASPHRVGSMVAPPKCECETWHARMRPVLFAQKTVIQCPKTAEVSGASSLMSRGSTDSSAVGLSGGAFSNCDESASDLVLTFPPTSRVFLPVSKVFLSSKGLSQSLQIYQPPSPDNSRCFQQSPRSPPDRLELSRDSFHASAPMTRNPNARVISSIH